MTDFTTGLSSLSLSTGINELPNLCLSWGYTYSEQNRKSTCSLGALHSEGDRFWTLQYIWYIPNSLWLLWRKESQVPQNGVFTLNTECAWHLQGTEKLYVTRARQQDGEDRGHGLRNQGSDLVEPCCYHCSVAKWCPALCDPVEYNLPGSSVLHYLLEFAQINVHWISDAIQPSHALLPPSPFACTHSIHTHTHTHICMLGRFSRVWFCMTL